MRKERRFRLLPGAARVGNRMSATQLRQQVRALNIGPDHLSEPLELTGDSAGAVVAGCRSLRDVATDTVHTDHDVEISAGRRVDELRRQQHARSAATTGTTA